MSQDEKKKKEEQRPLRAIRSWLKSLMEETLLTDRDYIVVETNVIVLIGGKSIKEIKSMVKQNYDVFLDIVSSKEADLYFDDGEFLTLVNIQMLNQLGEVKF